MGRRATIYVLRRIATRLIVRISSSQQSLTRNASLQQEIASPHPLSSQKVDYQSFVVFQETHGQGLNHIQNFFMNLGWLGFGWSIYRSHPNGQTTRMAQSGLTKPLFQTQENLWSTKRSKLLIMKGHDSELHESLNLKHVFYRHLYDSEEPVEVIIFRFPSKCSRSMLVTFLSSGLTPQAAEKAPQ